MQPPNPEKLAESVQSYETVSKALLRAFNRKENPHKAAHEQLLIAATSFILDKLVAEHPSGIPDFAESVIQKAVSSMKKAGVKPASLRKTWNAAELEHELTAAYLKLLK